jgi:hypothetical protein
MKYRESASKMDWLDLWLDKYSAELTKMDLSSLEVQNNLKILRDFLTKNPGNPRAIDGAILQKFVSNQKTNVVAPLIIFYDKIARSEKHLEILAQFNTPAKKKNPV